MIEEQWIEVPIPTDTKLRFSKGLMELGYIRCSNRMRYLGVRGTYLYLSALGARERRFLTMALYKHFVDPNVKEDVQFQRVNYGTRRSHDSIYNVTALKSKSKRRLLVELIPINERECIFSSNAGSYKRMPGISERYTANRRGVVREVRRGTGEVIYHDPTDKDSSYGQYRKLYLRSENDTRAVTLTLMRIIYLSQIGEIPAGMYVHPINGNPTDFRVENLKLANRKFQPRGEYHFYGRVKE